MAKLAYVKAGIRHNTKAEQMEMIGQADKWYIETSYDDGKMLKKMLQCAKKGDVLYVSDLLRITDSIECLVQFSEKILKKEIHFVSLKEKIDSRTMVGQTMLMAFKTISEFEKEALAEKHAKGIQRARLEGKYKGKKKKIIPGFEEHYSEYMARKITKIKLAEKLKISRGTLDRIIRDYERELQNKDGTPQIVPLQEGSKIGQLRFDDINMNIKEER